MNKFALIPRSTNTAWFRFMRMVVFFLLASLLIQGAVFAPAGGNPAPLTPPSEKILAQYGQWETEYWDDSGKLSFRYAGDPDPAAQPQGGSSTRPDFVISSPTLLTAIIDVHVNPNTDAIQVEEAGSPGSLALVDAVGNTYGPYAAERGGVAVNNGTAEPTVLWVVLVDNVELPAGHYWVHDSDPSTLLSNGQTYNVGATLVKGVDAEAYAKYMDGLVAANEPEPAGLPGSTPPGNSGTQPEKVTYSHPLSVVNNPPDPALTTYPPNNPALYCEFVTDKPVMVTKIMDYHINDGKGAAPGRIGLQEHGGTMYGSWPAYGKTYNGIPNAIWVVTPNFEIPAGSYKVMDNQFSTLSEDANNRAMCEVKVSPVVTSSIDNVTGRYLIGFDGDDGENIDYTLVLAVIDHKTTVEIGAIIEGQPFKFIAPVTDRNNGVITARYSMGFTDFSLVIRMTFTKKPDRYVLTGRVIGQGTESAGVNFSGSRTSTDLPGFIPKPPAGIGKVGSIPGPGSTAQAVAGIAFPTLATLIAAGAFSGGKGGGGGGGGAGQGSYSGGDGGEAVEGSDGEAVEGDGGEASEVSGSESGEGAGGEAGVDNGSPGTGDPDTGSPGTGSPGTSSPDTGSAVQSQPAIPGPPPVAAPPPQVGPQDGQTMSVHDSGDGMDKTYVYDANAGEWINPLTGGMYVAANYAASAQAQAETDAEINNRAETDANQIPDFIQNNPQLNGGPGDNGTTNFDGGDGPGSCSNNGLPNYWVNTANLNLYIEDTVFSYQGLGPGIALKLSYNSAPGNAGMFGRNWRFSYDSVIQQLPDRFLLWKGSGQRLGFQRAAQPAGQNPNTPQEAVSLEGGRDRLFDHGAYFLLLESASRLRYRYDKSPGAVWARLVAITDQNDNAVKLAYDMDDTLHSVTDAAGRVTSFVYDANRRCTGFSLPDGRQAKYAYVGQGHLTQAVDLLGTIASYEYDKNNSLTRMIVGRDQKTTTFTYQDNGQGQYLAGVTNAAGNSVRYELLSVTPRHVRVTDPEGQSSSYYSTPQGYTERVVDPLGNAVETSFSQGLPVKITNASKQSIHLEYDPRGNMIRRINSQGGAWAYSYDNNDRLISETNPLGAVWQYAYDEHGNQVRSVLPQGRAFAREYDDKGQLTAVVKAGGNKSTIAYDRFGNITVVTHALGDTTKYAYDGYGLNRVATTDANGNTTKYEYDSNHRLTRLLHPDGTSRVFDYDCCAGVAVTDENGHKVSSRRDQLLQVMEKVDALGNAKLFVYDRAMRPVKVQDPLGSTWELAYDPAGRMVQWANPIGETGRLAYDTEGNVTSLWDERGNKTGFVFDGNNQLVGTTDPLGHEALYTRDSSGRLTSVTNARGGTVKIAYDDAGRVIKKSYDGIQLADYEFDALDNLIQMRDAGGKTNFTFDGGDKVTSIRYPDALAVTYSYDPNGNLLTVTYPGEQVVRYSYDTANRVTQMSWGQHSISYRYDAVGNVIGMLRSNAAQTACEYDANNLLLKVTHQAGAEVFAELIYSRDQVGNIISENGVTPLQPQFEEVPVPITYNELNQIVRRGEEAYTYDADGNLTGIGMGSWQAKYDLENRPVEMVQNGRSRRMAYNGAGQRTLVETEEGGRVYHHDALGKLLFETDQSGSLIAFYLYRGAHLAARMDASGAVLFYHFDKTGNTLALSDQAGEVVAAYAYAPHGAVTNKFGEVDNPFTYVGEFGVMDEGNGLFYMRNRTYDALTGRFIQKDPLGFLGETNLYTYVSNNPIRMIDPAGFFGLDVLADPKFWLGGAMVTLGGIMTFAPTGITNAAGPGLAIAGWGLMATGGATMVYSAATTIDKDNINKAKNAVGQVNMSFLEEDDDEDLVLNEKGKLLQGNDLKRVLKAAEKFNNTCRPVKGR